MYGYDNRPPELRPLSPGTTSASRSSMPCRWWAGLSGSIHAIGATNINKRNFARSFFCSYILFVILIVVLAVSGFMSYRLMR